MRDMHAIPLAGLLTLLATTASRAEDFLVKGNDAYRAGKFEEAAMAYESEDNADDILVRRFNAGVSWAQAGQIDKALERFQEVAAKADDELRETAFYNAAHAAFTRGSALALEAEKPDASSASGAGGPAEPDARIKKLAEAASAFQQAVQLFRSIDPPDEAVRRNIGVTKTALRATLDAIARIEAEKKRQAEEDALKEPAQLLKTLAEKERVHRGLGRALSRETGKSVRLGSRRLRKSAMENRALAERLHRVLTAPPPAPPAPAAAPGQPQPPAPPEASEEDKARLARGAEHVEKAIAAMKDAEISHSKMEPLAAATAHSRAVTELRTALESFPMNIGELIAEAVGRQETLNGAMGSLLEQQLATAGEKTAADAPGDNEPPGAGKKLVDAIKDKVLAPLARLLRPENLEDARLLADDEDDVVWAAVILGQAEIPPTPEPAPPQPGQPPDPHATGQEPKLSAEEATKLSADLRAAGEEAQEASTRARDELAQGRITPALPAGEAALAALKRAAELLPRPPKTPVERLQELLEHQKLASQTVAALAGLDSGQQGSARKELERTQRLDGREAGGIAEELDKMAQGGEGGSPHGGQQPPEQILAAVAKVREGQEKVFSSAELLAQAKDLDALTAVDRDVVLFQEALDLLQGKKDEEEQKDEQKDEKKQDQQQQKQPEAKPQDDKKQQQMSPRDARFQQQEMDRKRRQEEQKLLSAPSTLTVEKDW